MNYEAQFAETTTLRGHMGDVIEAYELHTYENAGHAFFAVDRPQHRVHAAVDSWKRVFAWFEISEITHSLIREEGSWQKQTGQSSSPR